MCIKRLITFELLTLQILGAKMDSFDSKQSDFYLKVIPTNLDDVIITKGYYRIPNITMTALAKMLYTNRQYLSNYINREKHMNFHDYINSFRLKDAISMILKRRKSGNLSLEDIAQKSGFNSYATFLRTFSKVYGTLPSKYFRNK